MNIALLGFGVVGSGVYEWCRGCEDLHVRRVLVRSEKPQIADIATHDFEDILHDDSIDIVAEVMGGSAPRLRVRHRRIEGGQARGHRQQGVDRCLLSGADGAGKGTGQGAAVHGGGRRRHSVAGESGPVQKKLDTICRVGGIMNGTSNFIMDAMHKSPVSFPAILKQAQELGYAEADPSADIDGDDIRRGAEALKPLSSLNLSNT